MVSTSNNPTLTERMASPALLNLPAELLLNILKRIDPEDILTLRIVVRSLRASIDGNEILFKEICRRYLDEPPPDVKPRDWNWERKHKDLVALRALLDGDLRHCYGSSDAGKRMLALSRMTNDLFRFADSSETSLNLQFMKTHFKPRDPIGENNVKQFMLKSKVYTRSKKDPAQNSFHETFEVRQASAKLHCYCGDPFLKPDRNEYREPYQFAMSVVYDMRNYTDHTFWGPFLDDGEATVDWEKMEAIMIVLGYNVRCVYNNSNRRLFRPAWTTRWKGCQRDSYRTIGLLDLPEPVPSKEALDPYNITGSWMRIVTFLDYHELSFHNFEQYDPLQPNEPLEPINTTEAIRLIIMELRVTKIVTDPKHQFPKVFFKGTSRSLDSPHDPSTSSDIRGSVETTKEGEVRWSTISVYNGEERWKSEGIQVGGIRSARGVLGNWFDKEMDNQTGPAGPTAFWKLSNEIDQDKIDNWIDSLGSAGSDGSDDDEDDERNDGNEEGIFLRLLTGEVLSETEEVVEDEDEEAEMDAPPVVN